LRPQGWDFAGWQAKGNAPSLSWQSTNQASLFEFHDHAVDRRRCDSEVGLHVGLRGRSAVEHGVGVDEGEILALLIRETRLGIDRHGGPVVIEGSAEEPS
jgi:hypothetical protein